MLRQSRVIHRFRPWLGRFPWESTDGRVLLLSAATARVFDRSHYCTFEFGSYPFMKRTDSLLTKLSRQKNLSQDALRIIPSVDKTAYTYLITYNREHIGRTKSWAVGIDYRGKCYAYAGSEYRENLTDDEIIKYLINME